ncbi:MAG: helix-turn-helix domain-containing protein [Dehalococcoidia bacterium]
MADAQVVVLEFGEVLGDLLDQRHVRTGDLARQLQVDPSLVQKWLRGARVPKPNAGYVERLGEVLHLARVDRERLSIAQKYSLLLRTMESLDLSGRDLVLLLTPITRNRALAGAQTTPTAPATTRIRMYVPRPRSSRRSRPQPLDILIVGWRRVRRRISVHGSVLSGRGAWMLYEDLIGIQEQWREVDKR